MALYAAAYGFLVSERSLIPTQATKPPSSRRLTYPRPFVPEDPPVRLERNVEASIVSIRIDLARAHAQRLSRRSCRPRVDL